MSENASPVMQLTGEQAKIVVALERAGASLSMLGVLLIIVTFTLFKRLRTVPNTFILFASIANIGASTASLIGLEGIAQGSESTLCRAQAFLLEMFMQSDPWWSFAMAFNVFLVFFFSASPMTFRRHLWVYCLVCFGLPMVPAIVCLYIKTKERGPVYGDATLWCWISDEWNSLRIFTYYIPIWVCIFFSAVIYVAVGYHVFHQRNQLRNLSLSNPAKEASSSEPGFYGTVTTEVQITSDVCDATLSGSRTPPMTPLGSLAQCPWGDGPFPQIATNVHPQRFQNALNHPLLDEEMGIIPSSSSSSFPPPQPLPLLSIHGTRGSSTPAEYQMATTTISATPPPVIAPPPATVLSTSSRFRNNYRYHRHHNSCQPLQPLPESYDAKPSVQHVGTATTATTTGANAALNRQRLHSLRFSVTGRFTRAWNRISSKLHHMDPVKLAYLRTSFVFAISVLVTWTPSSINRIYALLYPTHVSYGLNIASATVLPLQGVWNAVIYFTTSWTLLREEVRRLGYRSSLFRALAKRMGMSVRTGPGMGVDAGVVGGMRLKNSRGRAIPGSSLGRPSASSNSNLGVGGNVSRAGPSRGSLARTGMAGGGGGGVDAGQHSRSKLDSGCFDDDSHDTFRGRYGEHNDDGASGDGYDDDRHDVDDTDDDSIINSIGRSGRQVRRIASASANGSTELELTAKRPRIGTLRVQKGGQLDT